ncbi:DUF3263 domain-containing protein, partial [Trueperella sp.]|uniref:DUF3263 domain-containing protein n=1 Tax=Trueperella sp. TaxID=2699835 RepID=UPI0037364595
MIRSEEFDVEPDLPPAEPNAASIERSEGERNEGELSESELSGGELSEFEASVLELERAWWHHGKTRDQAIRRVMKMSPLKYHLLLTHLLDSERLWRADPVLVDRL